MYLKALEIQGFKSFPDKTVLSFGEDMTAIVGPNGSGKSNISDAIRWVMGEQSSKALRGGKMEDVIFGGTAVRRQQGFAEVSLVLDNTDHIFPMEESEVMVTRRYYRSGESEYYINRRSVRLKDVNELFMDTGLGREGYSIIGQGRIDEILSVKSADRREVFEEIGYFDEMHFAYLEDIDVGYRAKIAGYYNLYCPSAKVFHVGSGTSGSKYNSFKVKLAARNNVYLNYKNMPAPQLLVNSLPIVAGIAGKYFFFKKLGFEKDYVAGVLEGIKTVKKTRKVPYRKEDFPNYLAIEWELIYGAALYIYEFSRRQIRKKLAGMTKS